MDQGCIAAMKKRYKTALLREVLAKSDRTRLGVLEFLKKEWRLYQACELVAETWADLSGATLKNAWKKLLKEYTFTSSNSTSNLEDSAGTSDVVPLLNKLHGDYMYSMAEAEEWLFEDDNAPVCQEYTLDDIVNIIHNPNFTVDENVNKDVNENEESRLDDEEEGDVFDEGEEEPENVSLPQFLKASELMFKFAKMTVECTETQRNMCKELRDMIVNKIINS